MLFASRVVGVDYDARTYDPAITATDVARRMFFITRRWPSDCPSVLDIAADIVRNLRARGYRALEEGE